MSDHVLIDLIHLYYDALERVLKKTDSTPIDWGWELYSNCVWVNNEFGWILYSLGIGKDAKGKILYRKKDPTRWITQVSSVNAWYVTPAISGYTSDWLDVGCALGAVSKPHVETHIWLRLHVGNDENPDEFVVPLDMAIAQYDAKIAAKKYPFAVKFEEITDPLCPPNIGHWINNLGVGVVPIDETLDETFSMVELEELAGERRTYAGFARKRMSDVANLKGKHIIMRGAFCDLAKERGLDLHLQ